MIHSLKRITTWGKFMSNREKRLITGTLGFSISRKQISAQIEKKEIKGVVT